MTSLATCKHARQIDQTILVEVLLYLAIIGLD
jgi:hypothetical protein